MGPGFDSPPAHFMFMVDRLEIIHAEKSEVPSNYSGPIQRVEVERRMQIPPEELKSRVETLSATDKLMDYYNIFGKQVHISTIDFEA